MATQAEKMACIYAPVLRECITWSTISVIYPTLEPIQVVEPCDDRIAIKYAALKGVDSLRILYQYMM
jgi:hypothetical protein